VHCRSESQAVVEGHPDFSIDEARRVLDDIASYAKPVVVLSGGEPLMRNDVFDIADYGTKLGLRMCLATNGALVTNETCHHIKSSGIRIVSMSLDGATAPVHDNFRSQDGAFDGVMRAAGLFKKHGIEFIINSSFTRRNQSEIPKIHDLAKELGATAWYMFMIVPTGRGQEILDELISKEEYENILNWHYDMEADEAHTDKTNADEANAASAGADADVDGANAASASGAADGAALAGSHAMLVRPTCAPHYYRIVLQRAKQGGAKVERRTLKFSTGGSKGCLAGQLICMIDVDGNVQPCSYFPVYAGNVRQRSFADIWENSKLFHDMRDFKSYKGRCGSCEYITVCGGCRARAYYIHGDYMEEEPFCGHVPTRMRGKEE
jgi:radical SAM protein with 4Fe4S-binding SPASM domain